MVETFPEGNVSIQTLPQWCALHKSDKHSDSDCTAQATSTANTSKKQPIGARKDSKPCRLKFKSMSDKKKFLRSIKETEGVSLESASSDDEKVVEQIFMQLDPGPSKVAL